MGGLTPELGMGSWLLTQSRTQISTYCTQTTQTMLLFSNVHFLSHMSLKKPNPSTNRPIMKTGKIRSPPITQPISSPPIPTQRRGKRGAQSVTQLRPRSVFLVPPPTEPDQTPLPFPLGVIRGGRLASDVEMGDASSVRRRRNSPHPTLLRYYDEVDDTPLTKRLFYVCLGFTGWELESG